MLVFLAEITNLNSQLSNPYYEPSRENILKKQSTSIPLDGLNFVNASSH